MKSTKCTKLKLTNSEDEKFQSSGNRGWEDHWRKAKKTKKVGDWLVDIALEGSGDYQVTERKRGFDDSISKLQHVHCIIHHIPHLRKRQGKGSGAERLRVKKQESLEMRKQNEVLRNVLTGINFILLSKHLTLKHANNKRETLAPLTEWWTQSRTHWSVFILNIHRKQSTVCPSKRRATVVRESRFYCFKRVRAVVATHFFTCIDK